MRDELILIAEDDANDALLVRRALGKIDPGIAHQFVSNGEDVIAYVLGMGEFSDREKFPFPTLLLLDMKMPRKGGLEVLEWLQANPDCRVVPTIVWSSSRLPLDIRRAYDLGANCFIVKPNAFDEIQSSLELAFRFWRMCEKPVP